MKSYIVVLLLGLVAAACVAGLMVLLPRYFRTAVPAASAAQVPVVVAEGAVPAMRILEASLVSTKMVPKKEFPEGAFTDAIQVLGKVLAQPMVAGQAITKASLVSEGQVDYVLGDGMRAVAVALTEHAALFGVLHTRSRVDVLASYKPQSGGEATSKVILHDIQVLAIGGQTLLDPEGGKGEATGSGRKRMVTLEVKPDQAKILQAAMVGGEVSLALRNPLHPEAVPVTTPESPYIQSPPALVSSDTWDIVIYRNGKSEVRKFDYVPAKINTGAGTRLSDLLRGSK